MKPTLDPKAAVKNKKYLAVGLLLIALAIGSVISDRSTPSVPTNETSAYSTTLWEKGGDLDGITTFEQGRQQTIETKDDTYQEEPWWSFVLGIGIKLAIVIVLIYVAVFALKRFIFRQQSLSESGSRMEILETRTLGPTTALHLVRIGDKLLLLGAGNSDVRILSEVGQAFATKSKTPSNSQPEVTETDSSDSFSAHLEAMAARFSSKKDPIVPDKAEKQDTETLIIEDIISSEDELEETFLQCRNYLHRKVLELRKLGESWEDNSTATKVPMARKAVAAASNPRG